MTPVFRRKPPKDSPRAAPMMMLGGSPLTLAAPPRLAVKISAMIRGMGSNFSKWASLDAGHRQEEDDGDAVDEHMRQPRRTES